MLLTAIKGFTISFSLICAIGAQNSFVLKQGLMKNNIFWVCITCFLCDILLITLGVFSVGESISKNKTILQSVTFMGAAFLFYYGYCAFRSAIKGNSSIHLQNNNQQKNSLINSILTTLGITLLNPHVYLDTVVIIGGISATLTTVSEKLTFMLGALLASFIWFFSLGYGANKLSTYFTHPKIWQILDIIIAIIMWFIALTLVIYYYTYTFTKT